MVITKFPPIETATEDGLLAIGGDVEVESLLLAYSSGIFPWPIFEDEELAWFAPPMRAVLFFDEFQPSKRLLRKFRSNNFQFRINFDFRSVINSCAHSSNRKGQEGTWITEEIVNGYTLFHQAGYCHSIESYFEQELVGGLYGVSLGSMFAGESMFYKISDASKLALCYLVEHLQERGATWLDCQQLTPLLEQLGARLIPREEFMSMLRESLDSNSRLF